MIGYIYKYRNVLNGKVYIGQTTNLSNRKTSHRHNSTFIKNKFYNAVRKYGWDNFEFDIVAQVEAESNYKIQKILDKLEEEYILQYDSFNNGYNSTSGGHCYRGKVVSEEFREYCINRTYSKETRAKMSSAAKNKIVTDETRRKLRENAIKKNIIKRLEKGAEKRERNKLKAISKAVVQIDKNGNIINEFSSLINAARFIVTNLAPNKTISGIEKGVRRHCSNVINKKYYYGFEWKYKANV